MSDVHISRARVRPTHLEKPTKNWKIKQIQVHFAEFRYETLNKHEMHISRVRVRPTHLP